MSLTLLFFRAVQLTAALCARTTSEKFQTRPEFKVSSEGWATMSRGVRPVALLRVVFRRNTSPLTNANRFTAPCAITSSSTRTSKLHEFALSSDTRVGGPEQIPSWLAPTLLHRVGSTNTERRTATGRSSASGAVSSRHTFTLYFYDNLVNSKHAPMSTSHPAKRTHCLFPLFDALRAVPGHVITSVQCSEPFLFAK